MLAQAAVVTTQIGECSCRSWTGCAHPQLFHKCQLGKQMARRGTVAHPDAVELPAGTHSNSNINILQHCMQALSLQLKVQALSMLTASLTTAR